MAATSIDVIDVHAHLFPAIHGQVQDGPTRGTGHGRMTIGQRPLQLTPDLGPATCFLPEMLLSRMDQAGVSRAVLLQGSLYGEGNAYAGAAVLANPDRLVAQAFLDPWEPGWEAHLDAIVSTGRFRGIKIEFSRECGLWGLHPGARLDDPALDLLWRTLAQRRALLTLDLGGVGSPSYQTEAVARLAQLNPALTVVVCHLAQPGPAVFGDPARQAQWEAQIDLGQLPNVYFDLASVSGYYRDEGDPFAGVRRCLEQAVARIGAAKLMWGSDAPGTLTLCSYQRHVELIREQLSFLPESAQGLILHGNARRVYFADGPGQG